MMTVVRKSGVSLMEGRREILHAISWQVYSSIWSPPTDMYETEDDLVVRVEIAGMKEDDFEVVLENNVLLIGGTRAESADRRAYHQMEIRFGKFATSVALPASVDIETARAEYKEGFLTVTLPKAKPNQIKVD
ncbi:MAG: Hsp20/alpha crystallin family protein [Chloroflexota bacterium]|jgi:HSP20 family protein